MYLLTIALKAPALALEMLRLLLHIMESKRRSSPALSSVSQCVHEKKTEILRRWAQRVRQEIPAAAGKSAYALINSLPQFLDNLHDALDQRSTKPHVTNKSALYHARQRAALSGYTRDQVQIEYTILRKVLFEVLEEHAHIDLEERNIILDLVVEARTAASDEYLRIAHEQTRLSEDRLALALESAHMGTFDWDVQSGTLTWSQTAMRLFGVSQSQVHGRIENFWQHIYPGDVQSVRDAIQLSFDRKQQYFAEFRVVWPDQSIHWIASKGSTYFDLNGKALRLLGTIIEITDRKHNEALLQNERAWYEMVLNWIPNPIILLDTESRSVFFENDASKNFKVPIPKVFTPNESFPYYATDTQGNRISLEDLPRHRVIRGEEIRDLELTFHTPKGEIPLLVDGKLLPAAYGRPRVGILSFRDITPLKQVQRSLERERELREQFVSMLSHDLRNPLTAAKINSQILLQKRNKAELTATFAAKILESIERSEKMIEDLLDANRIRAGKSLPIELENSNLAEIAEKTFSEINLIHSNRVKLRFYGNLEGYWSPKNIRRLFENLVANAIKYGFNNTPVTVTLSEKGSAVEISVHNFGEPIPPEERSRLFDPFTRSKAADLQNKKGWGLGLTLVKGVTEAHGGQISVQSEPDIGTTFTVILPKDARPFRAVSIPA